MNHDGSFMICIFIYSCKKKDLHVRDGECAIGLYTYCTVYAMYRTLRQIEDMIYRLRVDDDEKSSLALMHTLYTIYRV